MLVRIDLGSVSVTFLATQKAHRNTCKGAFHLLARPCHIAGQGYVAKEAPGLRHEWDGWVGELSLWS